VNGDHDINAVIALRELVGQDFATKETLAASIKDRDHAGATSGNASRNRVGAAAARIFNAPLNGNWRWWAGTWLAAYWLAAYWFTASSGGMAEEASVGWSRRGNCKQSDYRASGDKST
jgi:hypothetical protein